MGWYFLDPISDLFFNQYGLRPYFFGIIPRYRTINQTHPEITKLSREYVKDLDQTLDIKYLDIFFEDLHKILINRQNALEFFGYPANYQEDLKVRKLKLYNDELINIGNIKGAFERAQMYKYLNDRLFDRRERRHSKIWITNSNDHHIAFEIQNCGCNILYEEEKKDNKYVLIKK